MKKTAELLDQPPPRDAKAEDVVLAAIVVGAFVDEMRPIGTELLEACEGDDFQPGWRRGLLADLRLAYRRRIHDLRSLVVFLQGRRTWQSLEKTVGRQYYPIRDGAAEHETATGAVAWLRSWLSEHSEPVMDKYGKEWLPRLKDATTRRRLIGTALALLQDAYADEHVPWSERTPAAEKIADAVGRLAGLL